MDIFLALIISVSTALLLSGISIALIIKIKLTTNNSASTIFKCENKVNELQHELSELSKRMMNQAFRIAWLESKVKSRGGSTTTSSTRENSFSPEKLSITERRHRILSLARKGWDTNSIANTLGTTHGEIELIIDLHINSPQHNSNSESA